MSPILLFTQLLVAAEILAAISGCLTWKKWKHSYLKWFTVYLVVIAIIEFATVILLLLKKDDAVSYANQIAVLIEILFINWFFYKTLTGRSRKIIIAGVTAYITTLVLETTLIDGTGYYFKSLSMTVGNLFILIYLILFFIEFVNSEKLLVFKTQTIFWVALGMLVFYLGTFPFYGLYNELAKNLDIFMPLAWVSTGLNYSMYFLFTIGLIWGKPD